MKENLLKQEREHFFSATHGNFKMFRLLDERYKNNELSEDMVKVINKTLTMTDGYFTEVKKIDNRKFKEEIAVLIKQKLTDLVEAKSIEDPIKWTLQNYVAAKYRQSIGKNKKVC